MTDHAIEPVICKAAAVVTKGSDDTEIPYGTFEVILSTPTVDRDGEEVKAEEWKTPLPDHITFDVDHGMSVATTVGSGTPELDSKGRMIVKGRWASTPLAQQTRALVNEGHIKTTSVAFLRLNDQDDKGPKRELLNGAFVSIPANAEALILNSKSLEDQLNAPGEPGEQPAEEPADEPAEEPADEPTTTAADETATDPEGSTSASEDADPAAQAAGSASDDAETRALEADAIAKARALAQANSNLLAIEFGQ